MEKPDKVTLTIYLEGGVLYRNNVQDLLSEIVFLVVENFPGNTPDDKILFKVSGTAQLSSPDGTLDVTITVPYNERRYKEVGG